MRDILFAYVYIAIWIFFSAGTILFNKYLLANYGFPFPLALALIHMAFCSSFAFVLVRVIKVIPGCDIDTETYFRAIFPIGALFAGTLWLGNAAYLYLSVAFLQMLKAFMPVSVFLTGIAFSTEQFSWHTLLNMCAITLGVLIASYGEVHFVLIGFLIQLGSMICESSRLTLVQVLLQKRGLKLNPITSLYYVAPACLICLSFPFVLYELPRMRATEEWNFDPLLFLANAFSAFCLNTSVFLLIGKTSALTMNISGVVKDWMLIILSSLLFHHPVSKISLGGYLVSFFGVCYYNYRKLQAPPSDQNEPTSSVVNPIEGPGDREDEELVMLLTQGKTDFR
ncbi:hypothetical protein CYMTET_24049 [Cymbomonas tetramitiformis]|uniref:Sugar phosphate transporter domain-containing protein n=1 Tax=Cymbomonas tetramitiformis TaxID=36881 RepID=A0AAE0FWM7_9CHLO|nr:hypothetical protein CYMTET_24049 [Cymbomonas tetramitiformis]|eukprot:gene28232-34963_t